MRSRSAATQVLERVKEPLKTLISRNEPSTAHAVLSHVLLLVRRAPFLFAAVREASSLMWDVACL